MSSSPSIVFVCEYGSKKSVLAAAYFNHFAAARGLRERAIARGLNPDASIPAGIREVLSADGVQLDDAAPARLERGDAPSAGRVVSFADTIDGALTDGAELHSWADVPPLSEGFEHARDLIRDRVRALVDELAARPAR